VNVLKNQGEDAFTEVNILSLSGRELAPVLESFATERYSRGVFLERSRRVVDIDHLFRAYKKEDVLPNWFIDYT
jgi:hypothetical protein